MLADYTKTALVAETAKPIPESDFCVHRCPITGETAVIGILLKLVFASWNVQYPIDLEIRYEVASFFLTYIPGFFLRDISEVFTEKTLWVYRVTSSPTTALVKIL